MRVNHAALGGKRRVIRLSAGGCWCFRWFNRRGQSPPTAADISPFGSKQASDEAGSIVRYECNAIAHPADPLRNQPPTSAMGALWPSSVAERTSASAKERPRADRPVTTRSRLKNWRSSPYPRMDCRWKADNRDRSLTDRWWPEADWRLTAVKRSKRTSPPFRTAILASPPAPRQRLRRSSRVFLFGCHSAPRLQLGH